MTISVAGFWAVALFVALIADVAIGLFQIISGFLSRRKKMLGAGDMVLYTDEFDADTTQTPNVSAAMISKVYADGTTLDLTIFVQNGIFFKTGVPQDTAAAGSTPTRGTWHPKP